jgi:hypothetical protein
MMKDRIISASIAAALLASSLGLGVSSNASADGIFPDRPGDNGELGAQPETPKPGPLTTFSIKGETTLSSATSAACGSSTCKTSSCQCATISGTVSATGIPSGAFLLNLNISVDSSLSGPIGGECNVGDGVATITSGTNVIDMIVNGVWCNPGEEDDFLFNGTYYITPGGGKFATSRGTGNFSFGTAISPANTWLSANGVIQDSSGL